MAGLLDFFLSDNTLLAANGHSRRATGQGATETYTSYNTVGATQELHLLVSDPLPYYGTQGGPINTTDVGGSAVDTGTQGFQAT